MNANHKFLNASFDFIDNLESRKTLKVKSTYQTINDIELIVEKVDRCFTCIAPKFNLVADMAQHQSYAYGFQQRFSLISKESELLVPKGTANTNITIGNSSLQAKGEIFELEENFDEVDKKFFRIILPKSKNPRDDHDNFITGEQYSYENTTSRGFTEFCCNDNQYHLFTYYDERRPSIIIDCISPTTVSDLLKTFEAVTYTLGLLSGFVPKNEMYILQAKKSDFKSIEGFRFVRLEDTITSGMQIVDPGLLSQLSQSNYQYGHIPAKIFSTITTNAFTDKRFLRALKIISLANKYPLEIQASAYSVALETMKFIIIEENAENINPFKRKKFAAEIIRQCKGIVSNADDMEFNHKQVVIKKLGQLNQVTNRDGFKIIFELCKFPLQDSDLQAIDKRNDFLHGRIPFEDESVENSDIELRALSYKLHFLCVGLILKYSGYSGLLRNNPMYYKLLNGVHDKDETLFRNI